MISPDFSAALDALGLALEATPEDRHPSIRRAWLSALREARGHGLTSPAEYAAVLDA